MNPSVFVDRHADSEPAAEWSDTVPACFRSEAFAEDLQSTAATKGVTPSSDGPPAAPRRPRAAWGATLALLRRRPGAAP